MLRQRRSSSAASIVATATVVETVEIARFSTVLMVVTAMAAETTAIATVAKDVIAKDAIVVVAIVTWVEKTKLI